MKWSTFGKALWVGGKIAFKVATVAAQTGAIRGTGGRVLTNPTTQQIGSSILKQIEDEARIRRTDGK